MSKKHRKNHPFPAVLTPAALESQARLDLAEGRFRKARDAYKILCKQDREKYLPGLIDANRRLAAQLAERGQQAEAEQVLAYLKTIAPAETLHGMDLQSALKSADWPKAAALAAGILKAADSRVGEEDRAHAADALVLAFPEAAEQAALRVPDSLKAELAAILDALRGVSEEQFERAQELLRPLPRASVFASWKILIKGMIGFHTGDSAKAETLFAQLPEYGAPARAALAYRLALGDSPSKAQLPSAVEGACRLFGAPGMGQAFPRAQRLWAEGQHVQSYREMRAAAEFPAEEPSLAGVLSEFYFKIAATLHAGTAKRYLDAFFSREKTDSWKNPAEARWTLRLLGNAALNVDPDEIEINPLVFWNKFLKRCPREKKLEARVLERIAKCRLNGGGTPSSYSPPVKIWKEDAKIAIPLLKKCIDSDPTYLSAYLSLLAAYESIHETSAHEQLLEKMTRQFPDDPAVLKKAGNACLKRFHFAKGIAYLERARKLDPLDQAVLSQILRGYAAFGEQEYKKAKCAEARAIFETLPQLAKPDKIDLELGQDFLLARQSVLEMLFGDRPIADRILGTARETTRALPALLLFAHCYYRQHAGKAKKTPFWNELQKCVPGTAVERRSIFLALDAAQTQAPTLNLGKEEKFVLESLEPATGAAFTVEEAADLLALCVGRRLFAEFIRKLTQAGLKAAPENLRFRVFGFLADSDPPSAADLNEMQEIRELAIRQGDLVTADLISKAISQLPTGLPGGFGDDFDEDFDADEDDFHVPDLGNPGFDLDKVFPAELITALRIARDTLSGLEFAKLCRKAADGIPEPFFDLLMEKVMADKASPKPKPPPTPREKAGKPRPKAKDSKSKPPPPPPRPAPPPSSTPPAALPSQPAPGGDQLELF